jgi:hypothetical protein
MIFDPLLYVSKPTNPGKKVTLNHQKVSQFENYLKGFRVNLWSQENPATFSGTIFRLPLRQRIDHTRTEQLTDKTFSCEMLHGVVVDLIKPQVMKLLLFLNNIQEIEFLLDTGSNRPELIFSVSLFVNGCAANILLIDCFFD